MTFYKVRRDVLHSKTIGEERMGSGGGGKKDGFPQWTGKTVEKLGIRCGKDGGLSTGNSG